MQTCTEAYKQQRTARSNCRRTLQLQADAGGIRAHLLVVRKEADVAVARLAMSTQYRPIPACSSKQP
jgi:hypothetical protein